VRVTQVQADEGWTERMKRGTTASPQQDQPLYAVRPDAGTTLGGLEHLQADLCRSLGGVPTCPSALPDVLLLSFFQFLRNFRHQNAFEQAELILQAALDPAIARRARRREFVTYLDHFDLLQTAINLSDIPCGGLYGPSGRRHCGGDGYSRSTGALCG
jgi:hypothetical protein